MRTDKLKTGATYMVHHERKGKFSMRVINDNGEFVDGVILHGHAKAILRSNELGPAQEITVRKSLANFYLIKSAAQ